MYCYYDKGRILFLFAITWLYLWLRAIYVPLVHDEAATFFIYVQSGEFLPFHSFADANNHLLNSALSYLSFLLFGGCSLALRLPNLIMWPVYFFSVYFISARISNKLLQWVFILALLLAHNFIEFFGLCRGYGLSMGFLLLAILFLFRAFEKSRFIDKLIAIFSMLLAASANLTLINTLLLFILLVIVNTLVEKKSLKKRILNAFIIFLVFAGPLYYLLKWLFYLKESGLLYYHSVEGFVKATPGTLLTLLTGRESVVITWIFIVVIVITCILAIWLWIRSVYPERYKSPLYLSVFLLLGNIAAIVLGHIFFGVNYPEDRTAMFFFPLFILSAVFLMDVENNRIIKLFRIPVLLLLVLIPVHFIFSVNATHVSIWYQEGIPRDFYHTVLQHKEKTGRIPTLGGYMLRRFCWGYQNYCRGGQLPMIKTSGYPEMYADFQIVHMNKNIPWLYKYDQIAYDYPSGLSLLQRKKALVRKEADYAVLVNKSERITEEEYLSLLEVNIDSLDAGALFIEVSFNLATHARPFQAAVISSINDAEGRNVSYESIELNWYHYQWRGKDTSFHQGLLVSQLPDDASQLTVYIVNSRKEKYTISKPEVRVFTLTEPNPNNQP
ncbi:MAG: hypothetical protein AB9842_02625 [Bacteroidales bacterium]